MTEETRRVLSPHKKSKIPSAVIKMAIGKAKNTKPYRIESELAGKIDELIHEYDGMISCVAVVGVLELIKAEIIRDS